MGRGRSLIDRSLVCRFDFAMGLGDAGPVPWAAIMSLVYSARISGHEPHLLQGRAGAIADAAGITDR